MIVDCSWHTRKQGVAFLPWYWSGNFLTLYQLFLAFYCTVRYCSWTFNNLSTVFMHIGTFFLIFAFRQCPSHHHTHFCSMTSFCVLCSIKYSTFDIILRSSRLFFCHIFFLAGSVVFLLATMFQNIQIYYIIKGDLKFHYNTVFATVGILNNIVAQSNVFRPRLARMMYVDHSTIHVRLLYWQRSSST